MLKRIRALLAVSIVALLSGCSAVPVQVRSAKMSGVEHIPIKLGVFTFLTEKTAYNSSGLSTFDSAPMPTSVQSIVPPAGSNLTITQES